MARPVQAALRLERAATAAATAAVALAAHPAEPWALSWALSWAQFSTAPPMMLVVARLVVVHAMALAMVLVRHMLRVMVLAMGREMGLVVMVMHPPPLVASPAPCSAEPDCWRSRGAS